MDSHVFSFADKRPESHRAQFTGVRFLTRFFTCVHPQVVFAAEGPLANGAFHRLHVRKFMLFQGCQRGEASVADLANIDQFLGVLLRVCIELLLVGEVK